MKTWYAWILVCLLFSCREKPLKGEGMEEIVARVGTYTLLRREMMELLPKRLSETDSALVSAGVVKRWVKDVLVYEAALKNIGADEQEVLRMVEDYRRSLIRYRYQERLIQEKLSTEVGEGEKVAFYEENCKEFPLSESIIRGVFLKIPLDAPGLQEIKRLYRNESEQSLEEIEKYSMQNAILYEYFYDRWQSFEDVVRNIPVQVKNADAFLAVNRSLEVSDNLYCYLLHVSEYLPSGATAPYDFVSDRITMMLINRRKAQFLRDFEDELYETAISHGKVIMYDE
jgi:hypothetical protein